MKLTDNEKRDIVRLIEEGKNLPEKYRFLYVKQEDWDSLGLTPNSFEEILPIFQFFNT